jgi:AraC-like DNA-binding protein
MPLPRTTFKQFQRIDDDLTAALEILQDIPWGGWWFRCVEFHFERGNYKEGDAFGWHVHKEFQFEIPFSGEFEFCNQGKTPVTVTAGQVVSVPPNTRHRWACKQTGILLGITLSHIPRASSIGIPVEFKVKTPSKIQLFPTSLSETFFKELIASLSDRVPDPKYIASWQYIFIRKAMEGLRPQSDLNGTKPNGDGSARTTRVVSHIMRFIDANLANDLSMDRLQSAFSQSSRQIRRMFVQTTGKNCHEFIRERRLDAARSMIQGNPNLSVKEVAYACGFASPAHFSTIFKAAYGVSPSDYPP